MEKKQLEKNKQEQIGDALMKVALGCKVQEVTVEYAEVNGKLKAVKKRETKKDIPPDLKAVQILLAEERTGEYSSLSDEELEREKVRLLQKLKDKT